MREIAIKIVTGIVLLFSTTLYTYLTQNDGIVIFGESLLDSNLLQFAMRCEHGKFDQFGFSVTFTEKIKSCKVKSNSYADSTLNSNVRFAEMFFFFIWKRSRPLFMERSSLLLWNLLIR